MLEYSNESEQHSILASLAHQIYVAWNEIHFLAIKEHFRRRKMSVDTLMDEKEAVVLKNKKFDSLETSKTIELYRFCVSST